MPSRLSRAALALLLSILGLSIVSTPATAESTQPLTVHIFRVSCVDPCRNTGLEGADESAPDFYAIISFAGFAPFTTPRAPDDQDVVTPDWKLTRRIPSTVLEQDISIQIMDYDSSTADDLADASPQPGNAATTLKVNMVHGTVKGDLTSSAGCVAGNGEPGGGVFGDDPKPAVQVCLEITPNEASDTDGDGFTDYEEYRGIDFNGDDVVDLTLPGADAERRDLYVEIDWMKGEKPQDHVLDAVSNVFNNAPVIDRGVTGLGLHFIESEELPYAESIDFSNQRQSGTYDDFDDLKLGDTAKVCGPDAKGHFGSPADRADPMCDKIMLFKRIHFRYGIFIHGLLNGGDTSGRAEVNDRGGNDFVVSVGRWTDAHFALVGGRAAAEEATLLHELGHTLGLGHGGRYTNGVVDGINCKPNYRSVMNYIWQFTNIDPNRPFDYQRKGADTLLEDQLDETKVPGLAHFPADVIYGVGGHIRTADPAKAIDWTGDGPPYSNHATANINYIPDVDPDCNSSSSKDRMVSNPDWDYLAYDFTGSPDFADGAHGPIVPELSGHSVLRMASADLTAEMTVDKADATGGDTVTATVTIGNKGGNASSATSVTFTPPAGSPETRQVTDLQPGQTATETFTYTVPCATADGATLTGTAKVTGKNAAGVPEPDEMLADNTATATTKVHAPALAVTTTATSPVNAGEAISYTVGSRNTGSAPATGAALTYSLPAGVYYSQALDQGAGPRPATVTRNDDGTTTLTWSPGTIAAGTAGDTVTFTARPSLLMEAGGTVTGTASLTYGGANGCVFTPATASAQTTITAVAPSRQPLLWPAWALRQDLRTAEALARVQATDTRFDAADGSTADGALSQQEVSAVLLLPATQPRTLRAELLATTLNLATRRINAATEIHTITTGRLGLHTVGDAVRYAQATLAQPPGLANLLRYTDATLALTEINSGLAERY
ncbi:CARDB domain-containing protein [Nonomuraea sp. NPDC050536]|uniref:CARDB domain-containing protein n=1 Tax=Nonomuraea sp. NPDC050536 TaxID=3364366 RepID=UPI0037C85A8E